MGTTDTAFLLVGQPYMGNYELFKDTGKGAGVQIYTPDFKVRDAFTPTIYADISAGNALFNEQVTIADGTQGIDKVLTSDATGNASWKFQLEAQVTPYTITPTDIANQYFVVAIAYDNAFLDTNYSVTFSINDKTGNAPSVNLFMGDYHDKTPTGCNYVGYTSGLVIPNSVVEINTIAIHK